MSNFLNSSISNVAVIIRSVGERTEALCRHLVEQQVSPEHVVVIHERPFSKAVQRSFEIGLDFRLDWTLCVDADVLLREDGIQMLVEEASKLPESTFTFSGCMIDKLLGHSRPGGGHLYRTRHCQKALEFIEESDAQIRPETYVKVRMRQCGYPDIVDEEIVIGIHDFEQYYADIYRKAIVHTHKFNQRLAYAGKMWERLANVDQDYQVALWGFRVGQLFEGKISINRDIFPEEIDTLLKLANMTEKPPLTDRTWDVQLPELRINQYSPPQEFVNWQRIRSLRSGKRRFGTLRAEIAAVGVWRLFPWKLGRMMQLIGTQLQKWAEKDVSPGVDLVGKGSKT